jgi:hypothetical protein
MLCNDACQYMFVNPLLGILVFLDAMNIERNTESTSADMVASNDATMYGSESNVNCLRCYRGWGSSNQGFELSTSLPEVTHISTSSVPKDQMTAKR